MKTNLLNIIVALIVSPIAGADERMTSWGMGLGFGDENAYIESHSSLQVLSPILFQSHPENGTRTLYRMVLDADLYDSTLGIDSFQNLALSIEISNSFHKDIVKSYARLGTGTLFLDEDLYEGDLVTGRIAFGLVFATAPPLERMDSGIFIEYRSVFALHDEED